MKNIIASLACLLVLWALLAGCSPRTDVSATYKSPEAETEELADPPEISPPEVPPMVGMGNSALNIRNSGYAALSDDALYYADRQNGGNIWRADPEGGNARLLAEGSFTHLNVSGGRLFFADWDGIYVMPTEGAQPELIKECSSPCLCVLDEWLYYTEDACIYRMRADGTETELLGENIAGDVYKSFIIDGDHLITCVRRRANAIATSGKPRWTGAKAHRYPTLRYGTF